MNHGAWGELGPVVAMAILLGTGGAGQAIVAIIMFGLIQLRSLPWRRLRRDTSKMFSVIQAGSETTGQTTVRLTVLLLVALCVLAELFELDVVLGAFAAGFVLRQAIPQGDEQLEHKLNGLAFGMLIPVFFVTSGMAIDARAVAAAPSVLIVFVLSSWRCAACRCSSPAGSSVIGSVAHACSAPARACGSVSSPPPGCRSSSRSPPPPSPPGR